MNNNLKNELNDCKKECDRRFDIFFEDQELNDYNHTIQQRYIVQKLIKLNKLFNESEYNDDEFITVNASLSILYKPKIKNNDYRSKKREIKIFKEKLGMYNDMSIFLSKYGNIVYQLDDKYYFDIHFGSDNIDDIYKYWDKHNEYINFQIDEFHLEPDEIYTYTIPISKKYKDDLIRSIKIDSKMELEKFTYYMGKHVPIGLESLYKQLTFMENLFFDKMNDKMKLLDEVIEMNRKLIDIKL